MFFAFASGDAFPLAAESAFFVDDGAFLVAFVALFFGVGVGYCCFVVLVWPELESWWYEGYAASAVLGVDTCSYPLAVSEGDVFTHVFVLLFRAVLPAVFSACCFYIV